LYELNATRLRPCCPLIKATREMSTDNNPAASPASPHAHRPRLICFANCTYDESFSGGDIYFYFMVKCAMDAGYPVHFFGGSALRHFLKRWKLPENLTLTDAKLARLGDVTKLAGQLRLLWDYIRRFTVTMLRLDEVKPDDVAYVMSDFWFEVIPLACSRARLKILHLGMMAPTLKEVLLRQRADVTPIRLPSLYYWLSQQVALRWFRHARGGVVTYCHPEIRPYLLKFGYLETELYYVPNGSDTITAELVPTQPKQFDVAWLGRVHPQKGIDDLLETLTWLKEHLTDFRAIIIGKSKDLLEPVVQRLGLAENVTFSGLVTEQEKFRLLKSSRLFLMPSHYESWGIVVAEALVSGTPVLAYKLSCYPDVFGDFVRYVKPFDREEFKRAAENEISNQRAGNNYMAAMNLTELKKRLAWSSCQNNFRDLLNKMDGSSQVS
jgi:glycosyltransferase involved in cell wall biosynthesis